MADEERLGGGWLLTASVLFWISWSLMPGVGVTDTRMILERVVLQRDAVWLSTVLQLVSAACFAPPLVALGRVGRARGSRALEVGAVVLAIGAMGSAADAIFHLLAYYMTAPGMQQDALVPLMDAMQGPGLAVLAPMLIAFFVGAAMLAIGAANVGLVSRRNPWLHAAAVAVALSAPLWAKGNPAASRAAGLTVLALVSLSLAGIGLGMSPHLTGRRLAVRTVAGFFLIAVATYLAGERTEVVVLRTQDAGGAMHETKMWCVDHDGAPWVRVANAERGWYRRLVAHPGVELVRQGATTPRVAHPDPSPATRSSVDAAFAEKYGLTDFWYGAILRRGAIPIRLDPRAILTARRPSGAPERCRRIAATVRSRTTCEPAGRAFPRRSRRSGVARPVQPGDTAMPTASEDDRSHASLWSLLNRPHSPEPDTMRVGCGALFVVYAVIVVLRSQEPGPAFLGLRVGMLFYAALGVWLAGRASWRVQRLYTAFLALILPLQAAYVSAVLGNDLGDVAFTALALFAALIFVQTARDLILIDLCLIAGYAVILAASPTPALPIARVAVTLGAVLVTASVVVLRTLVYRARLAESVARLEAALADRAAWQSRYEAATAASGQVLYDWEPATDRIRWGGACEQILGYTARELDGGLRQWSAMIHPDDVARFDDEIASVLERRCPLRLRYRVRRKDGTTIVVDDTGHFVFGERGEIVRMVGFVADVTERSAVELARDEEAAISAALVRVGRELISSLETPVVMDRLCRVTAEVLGCDFSQTWIRQPDEAAHVVLAGHGLSAEEWEHLRLLRLPADPSNALLARVAEEGVVEVQPTTTTYPLAASLLAHYGLGATYFIALRRGEEMVGVHLVGYRGSAASFSERQRRIALGIGQLASMGLTNARLVEELERASNLKSEFVSTMSHELRTPLNVILGYAEMLADETLSASQQLLVSRVRCSSIELLEMIEATLDLNRIAAGKDVPTFERLSLAALWVELATEFEALPRKDPIALRWEPPGDVWMCTDRRKLKMVLKNLVANAIKFTAAGEVVVACAMSEAENGLVFTVRDTGIGIPAEHLASIFDMFRQVDSSDARSYSGVGLGLYIVRQLATQLGGTVEVDSEPGRGSTFRVRLPLAPRGDRRIAA